MAKKKTYTYETVQEFLDKMNWEGGPHEFADYGCDPAEIKDPKLRKLWADYMAKLEVAQEAENKLTDFLGY